MNTATRIIALLLLMASCTQAETNRVVILGKIDPDATLQRLQSMAGGTNADRLAIVTWFPSQFWETSCLIYTNGDVRCDTSSPMRGHHFGKHVIQEAQLLQAVAIARSLPPSSPPENHQNMLILSVRAGNTWTNHVYDRARPPERASAFCAALGIGEKLKMNPEPPAGGDGKPASQP